MSYVYLKFPELKDFVEYLKERRIHRYGAVLRLDRKTTANGIPLVHYFNRLTAKDDTNMNIIVCDVTIYRGLDDRTNEQLKKAQEEALKKIEEAFKGEYQFTEIDAEYRLTE